MNTLVTVGCSVEGRRGGAQCSVSSNNPSSLFYFSSFWLSSSSTAQCSVLSFKSPLYPHPSSFWISCSSAQCSVSFKPFLFFLHPSEYHLQIQFSVLSVILLSSLFHFSYFWIPSSSTAQCFVSLYSSKYHLFFILHSSEYYLHEHSDLWVSNHPFIIPISSFIFLNIVFINSSGVREFQIILLSSLFHFSYFWIPSSSIARCFVSL